MTCYIFGAGSFFGLAEKPKTGDLILAADAGYRNCLACHVKPDIVIGDFDSMKAPEQETLLRLPVEKDDTDTLYAMRIGLERGCRDFVIYGGTGGSRADHTIANLQSLLFLVSHGARGRMYGDGVLWRVIRNERVCFPASAHGTLSLFCPDGEAWGVTIMGLKYELENGIVRSDYPIGVSNSFLGREAYVEVLDGNLLMTYETDGIPI